MATALDTQKLIVPGKAVVGRGLPLILPPSVSRSREAGSRVLLCTVPGCGEKFPFDKPEAFARHVRDCADRNHDQIEADVAKSRESYFTKPADEEMYAHYRRGGT